MALCILPIEISHFIASLLDTDRDVCNYISVCRQTYAAIGNDQSHIWRKRFLRYFDVVPGRSTAELERKYKLRRKILRGGAGFSFGHEFKERLCLDIIRELIVESFSSTLQTRGGEVESCSRNVGVLYRFVKSTNLLDNIFRFPPERGIYDPLLMTIQLLLTHWSLDLGFACQTFSFAYSQEAVYGHPKDFPMFLDKHMRVINIEYLLHIANFFKYHMIRIEESTLYYDVLALEEEEKPIAWKKKLEDGVRQLGRHWMGSYAYPEDPIEVIRDSEPTDQVFLDVFENDDGFQTMELNFNPSNPTPWPEEFETHLHSIPPHSHSVHAHINSSVPKRARNVNASDQLPRSKPDRTAPQYLRFEGSGFDRDHFHCAGHIHAVPAQHGIPGWQRITLMKYVLDGQGFYDPASCWAYEGVVLPGGQIILGRWWSPLHDVGDGGICGPFIFWNVRGADENVTERSPADSGCFVLGDGVGKDYWV